MSKLSEQHEAFCRNVVEGMSNGEAYMAAGYKCAHIDTASAAASRLLKDVRIQQRIAELRANASESAEITLQWLMDKAREVLFAAMADKSHAASIGAIKELGILSGQRVEKSQRENINRDVDQLTEAELAEYLTSAGSAGVAGPQDRAPKPDQIH